ncbi:MAG: TolC family protein [Gammaproteobacteria bacterium]|nr:TolC family protein [Gammaproteobacteria bacterium]NBT45398.1 TolC family protein [Gammaproteobacteria bacterium]NBY21324.1 TolC family protein [Gammaproteobacteria bacterium]
MKRGLKISRLLASLILYVTVRESDADAHTKPHQPTPHQEKDASPTSQGYLRLEQVIQSALQSFPALLAASKRQEMATGEKLAAEGGFDTILKMYSRSSLAGQYQNENVDVGFEQPTEYWGTTFFGGYRRGVGKYPVYEGKSETATEGEVRAGVLIPLWRNRDIDRRRANLAQADLSQIIAGHEYDQQLLELERQASYRYWDWVLAGRRVGIARHLLDVAKARNKGLRDRIHLGDLPAIDATENQRAVVEREERLVAAERALEQSAIQLSLFLRTPEGDTLLPSTEDLPQGFPKAKDHHHRPLEDLIDDALLKRPEIKRIETQIRHAQVESQLVQNQRLPAVDLTISGAQDFGVSQSNLVNRSEFYAGVIIDMPVQQRVAVGKGIAAEANISRLMADRQLAEDRVRNEIRDAVSAIKAAFKRIALADQQRSLARQLEEGEKTKYEFGESHLMLVNLRELASGDASMTYVDALNSYHRALADFRFSSGEYTHISEDGHHHSYRTTDYDFDPTS